MSLRLIARCARCMDSEQLEKYENPLSATNWERVEGKLLCPSCISKFKQFMQGHDQLEERPVEE